MKNYTKKDLFAFLNAYYFTEPWEVEMAICSFFREYVEKDEDYQPSYWELAYYSELANEYIEKNLNLFLPY